MKKNQVNNAIFDYKVKNNNYKVKNNNYVNNMINNWKINDKIEENTNPIINNKNNYSLMTYGMWLSIKNSDEKCSFFDNAYDFDTNTVNKIINKNKNKIKIYTIVIFHNIFSCFHIKNF